MDKKTGVLSYNYDNNRFGILDKNMELWINEGLYCGDSFEIFINGEWQKDRIEMTVSKEWYLVNSHFKDTQLEYIKVKY